jgi:hypothetical protein
MIATKKVREMNPEELKAYRHACYVANPKASHARTNRWRKGNPNVQKRYANNRIILGLAKAACKRWRAAHPEYAELIREGNTARCKAWRESNPEAFREWCLANPVKLKERNWRRRAVEHEAAGTFTAEEFRALGNTCLRCGRSDVPMTPDHVMPLSKGGSNTIENIQPLCGSCSSSKKDKCADYR